jgi:pSer/pThr/pTyr-binding forkhead associated (FHA) protein
VPFLRELIRTIFGEAKRSCGESSARRGYRAAVSRLWGAHERVLLAAQRITDDPRPPRARLVTPRGTVELGDREQVIGRAAESEIQIVDPAVSRRHARIVPSGNAFALQDLGSTTGTLVNGKRLVGDHLLQRGDEIRLGEVSLRYQAG